MPDGAGTSAQCRCDCNVILGPGAHLALGQSQGEAIVQGPATQSEGRNRVKPQLWTELLPLPCADILNKNPICAILSSPAPPLTTVADPWGMVQQVTCGAEQQHNFYNRQIHTVPPYLCRSYPKSCGSLKPGKLGRAIVKTFQ